MSEMDTRGDERPFEDDELSVEADPADAADQHRLLQEEEEAESRTELPLEVDPADAADQDRTVRTDDDEDYR